MKTHSLISLCVLPWLLTACPSGPGGGLAEEGSTGIGLTDSSPPTTGVMTTAVDAESGVVTSEGTTHGASTQGASTGSSGDEGPPPECTGAADCDDRMFCNGAEACIDGSCAPGEPPTCDDTFDCTADACDDARGACTHDPDDTLCGCGETCDPEGGCGNYCVITDCQGQVYQCGNCIDDDGDCGIDFHDTDCWGPCDNNESGWSGEVPGQQNQSECNTMDCYFDANSGAGNDDCYWSHSCDPLEPTECTYDPNTNIPGTLLGCDELQMMQSMTCLDYCAPLVPNGCDCFGCCDVTVGMTMVTVYLGSADADGVGTCNIEVVEDPALCNPCTQVAACLNTCEECELCIGQQELPPGCVDQECPPGLQACGLPGQDPCTMGQACVTGCCVPNPQ